MREYDAEVLRAVQQCELDILWEFDEVCKRHNLSYFGLGGTGIGALRHGGFIPWDDDIDVAMLRDDYETLLSVYREEMADRYTVVEARYFDDCPVMNTHLVLNGTRFSDAKIKNPSFPDGIFLDVFPFDAVSADPKEKAHQIRWSWFWSKCMLIRDIPFPRLPFGGVKAVLVHAVTAVAGFGLRLFGFSHKRLYRAVCKAAQKKDPRPATEYAFLFNTRPGRPLVKKEEIFPLRRLPFETGTMPFPNRIEDILTQGYGDYMTLPPPEKRKNHAPEIVQLPGGAVK